MSDLLKDHRCGLTHPALTTYWIFPLTEDMKNFNWTTSGKTEMILFNTEFNKFALMHKRNK